MQPNGGFFGSMMPQNASSFMPPINGSNGTAQAFTSPPIDPKLLAALTALANGGGQQQGGPGMGMGPGTSALPPNATLAPGATLPGQQPGQQPGGAPAAGGGQPNIMDMLSKLDPATLKGILGRLGIGGPSGGIAGQPNMTPPGAMSVAR